MSLVDKVTAKGRVVSPVLHLTIWFLIFSLFSALLFSFILRVEIVARGAGKIIPLMRVQVVQSEQPGKIKRILVHNGDLVKKGDLLVELDKTLVQAELNKIREEINRLKTESQRINIFRNLLVKRIYLNKKRASKFLNSFKPSKKGNIDYFNEQKSLLYAEVEEIRNEISHLNAKINSNKKLEQIIRAEMSQANGALKLEKERFIISKKLFNKKTISRVSYLDALGAYNRLQKGQNIYQRRLEQNKANEQVLYIERQNLLLNKTNMYSQRSNEVESRLSVLAEDLVSARRRLTRMSLLSPVTGYVEQLTIFTIGGVAQAGQELMKIVPNDNVLELEAVFTNSDIGFIEKGQQVNIKLDAFPAERFGMLKGQVSNVSTDAVEIPNKGWGFVVRVKPDAPYLKTKVAKYQLRSGMTSTVDIITGDRNLISYFFAPILKTIQDSMGER